MATWYQKRIAEITGETDERMVRAIEECMRDETGGVLDSITPQRFVGLAKASYVVAKELVRIGLVRLDEQAA